MRTTIIVATIFLLLAGTLIVVAANRHGTPLQDGAVADLIIVDKSERTLSLYRGKDLLKRYDVSLGRNPEGQKQQEGDKRTPEGEYVIDFHKRDSAYHRALHITYPNASDRARAKAAGDNPGGDIMVHGLRNGLGFVGRGHLFRDWTQGCIAVTNDEIRELWRAVPDGTRIVLEP